MSVWFAIRLKSAMHDKWPKQVIAWFPSLGNTQDEVPLAQKLGIQASKQWQSALTYVTVVDRVCARIAACEKFSEPKYPAICRGGTQGQKAI